MKFLSKIHALYIVMAGVLILCVMCAAPVSGIRVTGSKYMNSLSPGDTTIHKMTISTGPNDPPMDMQVEVWGFGQSLQNSYSSLPPAEDTSPYSARSLITLTSPSLHLNPGESKEITATIAIPASVGDGGRYALITIHNAPVGNGSTAIVTAISVPVLITIAKSKISPAGSIVKVSTADIIPGQPIRITTALKNTGNIHYYKTKNSVSILDSTGKEVATAATEPSSYANIPTFTVNYEVNVDTPLPPGAYTATSKVSLEDGTVLDTKSTSFEVQANYIPPLQAASIKLTAKSSAVLASPDGRVTIEFPAGAVFSDTDVTMKPLAKDQAQGPSPGMAPASTFFKVDGINGLLAKDATLIVKYTSVDLEAARSDVSKLVLARYDDADSKWTILPTTLDKSALTLSTATNRFGTLGVMVSSGGNTQGSSQGSAGSTASGGSKPGIGLDTSIVFVALGLMIVFVGIHRSRKH
jgi:methionine-rich copper-binding protein CopC